MFPWSSESSIKARRYSYSAHHQTPPPVKSLHRCSRRGRSSPSTETPDGPPTTSTNEPLESSISVNTVVSIPIRRRSPGNCGSTPRSRCSTCSAEQFPPTHPCHLTWLEEYRWPTGKLPHLSP